MTYYDQIFTPWEIVDGKCVVANEAEWNRMRFLSSETRLLNSMIDRPIRPVVKVPTDIFEDVEGPVANSGGDGRIFENPDGEWMLRPANAKRVPYGSRWLDVPAILKRFLQTIDATPHVDYLLMTQHPELVIRKWGMPPGIPDTVGLGEISRPDFNFLRLGRRENITLATYVETQADIERLVPELLKCHDLAKGAGGNLQSDGEVGLHLQAIAWKARRVYELCD